jgi:hypothetical protein
MYVYYGTNEYNFEKLTKVPTYEPTLCATCATRIDLGEGGYSQQGGDYTCMTCSTKKFREMFRGRGRSNAPESS